MPAASMAGAWKAYLEGLGLGLPVFRDGAPVDVEPPFVVVVEGIGYSEHRAGKGGEVTVEAVQVDLYQPARAAVGTRTVNVESYTLPDAIAAALHGRGIAPHAPWHVYGVVVPSARRWPPADNVVRHTWTPTVTRARARKDAA